MQEKRLTRKQAIIRRRIFLGAVAVVLALVIALAVFIVTSIFSGDEGKQDSTSTVSPDTSDNSSNTESGAIIKNELKDDSKTSNTSSTNSQNSSGTSSAVDVKLDANFSNLLLVNGENPLPENYDSDVRKDLVEIDAKYRNNNYVTQIHKDVYPYITAMVAAAQKDGVDLRVWSPFRSYAIQKDLFQKQVNRVGGDEEKAATVVARPGTSEHNTGLCADFNMASDAFEKTEMYRWMCDNAEDYGFVMRYRKDKQPITGVIHESWHWRFVGINHAKEMNRLDMCLEEYVEYLENKKENN